MRHQLTYITTALTSLMILALTNQFGQAQGWPRDGATPVQAVPQYVPRYPLHETAIEPPSTKEVIEEPVQLPAAPNQNPAPLVHAMPLPTPVHPPVAKPKTPPHFGVDDSIYRDTNMYPIDPRKPCNQGVRPSELARCASCGGRLAGKNGKPFMDQELGGCTCQKKNPNLHPQFSLHWPRPMSARLDQRFPGQAAQRYSICQPKRWVDKFDHLSTFKLSSYLRTDNGYSGSGADPYGCLGESKQRSNVIGVGYRFPSEPVQRGFDQIDQYNEGYRW